MLQIFQKFVNGQWKPLKRQMVTHSVKQFTIGCLHKPAHFLLSILIEFTLVSENILICPGMKIQPNTCKWELCILYTWDIYFFLSKQKSLRNTSSKTSEKESVRTISFLEITHRKRVCSWHWMSQSVYSLLKKFFLNYLFYWENNLFLWLSAYLLIFFALNYF